MRTPRKRERGRHNTPHIVKNDSPGRTSPDGSGRARGALFVQT